MFAVCTTVCRVQVHGHTANINTLPCDRKYFAVCFSVTRGKARLPCGYGLLLTEQQHPSPAQTDGGSSNDMMQDAALENKKRYCYRSFLISDALPKKIELVLVTD